MEVAELALLVAAPVAAGVEVAALGSPPPVPPVFMLVVGCKGSTALVGR